MDNNKLLKFGMIAAATAVTTAGSILLADKSLKNLVKGVVGAQPTKVRQPVKDSDVPDFAQESVVREPYAEPAEEILPKIDLNDITAVINNANANVINDEPQVNPVVDIEENADVIGPIEEAIPAQPIIPNDGVEISNPFASEALPEIPLPDELPTIETKQDVPEQKPEIEITMGLPYIAGRLEDLELNDNTKTLPKNMDKQEVKTAEPDVENVSNVSAKPQDEIKNPFFDASLIDLNLNQEALPVDDSITITRPATDEPIVELPPDEDEVEVGESPVIVSGPYIDQQKEQLPPEPKLYQSEPQVNFENNEQKSANTGLNYGDPIISNHMELGKTKVIGTNIVSDEPYNKAIETVAKKFPNVQKDRLVSIMSQDGAGIVFEFSNNRAKNEDTLVNVYSIKQNGDVMLPSQREKAGAIEFGKTFITDKPELSEFFTR